MSSRPAYHVGGVCGGVLSLSSQNRDPQTNERAVQFTVRDSSFFPIFLADERSNELMMTK